MQNIFLMYILLLRDWRIQEFQNSEEGGGGGGSGTVET